MNLGASNPMAEEQTINVMGVAFWLSLLGDRALDSQK